MCLGLDHSRVLLGYTNLEVITSCMETKKQNKTKKPVFKKEKNNLPMLLQSTVYQSPHIWN